MWLITIFLLSVPAGISLAGKILLISVLGIGDSEKGNFSWVYRDVLVNVSVQITEQVAFLLVFQRITHSV